MNEAGPVSDSEPTEPAWVEEVLRYWFDEVGEAHWFKASAQIDGQIRARFLRLHQQVSSDRDPSISGARAMLAAIVVLDQFSRNLFRGTARAYAADAMARHLAGAAIDKGYDLGMTDAQRQFIYMPFQHSEDRADQRRSVTLVEKLGHREWTQYARAHKSIIDRFGRFPHRNAILGRISSAEELASLNEPMGSF